MKRIYRVLIVVAVANVTIWIGGCARTQTQTEEETFQATESETSSSPETGMFEEKVVVETSILKDSDDQSEALASIPFVTAAEIYEEHYNGALNITKRQDEQNREFYGVVDATGNTIIECNYSSIGILSEDRIVAHVNLFNWENQFARIFDNRGNIISDGEWKEISFIYKKQEGGYPIGQGTCYIPYGLEGVGYYLINNDGKKVIETKFDYIYLQSDWDNYLKVKKDDETYVIDLMGNRIESIITYENFHNSNFIKTMHLNGSGVYDAYGLVDADGNTIIECVYDDLYMVNGDRIITQLYNDDGTDSAAYIFDLEGNLLSDGEWRSIGSTQYNAVIGKDYIPDGKDGIGYYLIDYNGDKIIPTRFDKIFSTHEDYPKGDFAVTVNGETYDIDSMGNRVS